MDGFRHLFRQSLIHRERLEALWWPAPVLAAGEAGRLRRWLRPMAQVARDDTRRRRIEAVVRCKEPLVPTL